MKKLSFIARPMQLSDISDAMKLSTAEGWNQTEKDWKLLIENSQNTCLLAEADKKIIGTATAINYSNDVAWIGMMLVDAAYRGRGVSTLLLTNILKEIESCKSIKLDATPAGQAVYKKFRFEVEYLIARMINTAMPNLRADDYEMLPEPIQLQHINEIAAFDKLVFEADRTLLIESFVREYPAKAWLLKRNDQVAGYMLGRDGNKYHHVGPVMAATFADAKILIAQALKTLNNQPVVADVLNDKEDLLKWLQSIGFIRQRHFVRMYKKENPFPGVVDKLHLICGPEFG